MPTTTAQLPAAPPTNSSQGECSLWDPTTWGTCINNMLTGFFRGLVGSALNPLLDLLGKTLLTTPSPDSLPQIGQLWSGSWQILLASYSLVVVVAGVLLMAYETMQTRYTVKEIAPRLAIGFLAGGLSLFVATKGIEIANAVSGAVMGAGVDMNSAAETLKNIYLTSLATYGFFEILLELALAGGLVAVLITYVVRVALTVILIAGAPVVLMAHALPVTEGIARWWWKAFGGCLAIQVAQSMALIVALRVLLTPGFTPFGPNANGLVNLLVGLALVYILFKIPFWILGAVRGGGSRSLISSLIRGFVAYKTFGILRRLGGGSGRRQSGRRPPTNSAAPFAKPRTTSSGQYVLPLPGLKRGRLPKPAHHAYGTARTLGPRRPPSGVQLALPLNDDWPENKPILGRDGQYRLPLDVQRVARPAATPRTPQSPGPTAAARPRARQLELPFDPYKNNRPLSSGQYALPLAGLTRVPRPSHATGPMGSATRSHGRPQRAVQPELPFDPYKGNRPSRSGQYPIPLPDLRRQPAPKPAPPVTPKSVKTPAQQGKQTSLPLNLPKVRPPRPTHRPGGDSK